MIDLQLSLPDVHVFGQKREFPELQQKQRCCTFFLKQVFGQRSINRTAQVRFLRCEDGSLVIFNAPALTGRCIMRFSLSSNRKFPIYCVWLETFPEELSFRPDDLNGAFARIVFGQ